MKKTPSELRASRKYRQTHRAECLEYQRRRRAEHPLEGIHCMMLKRCGVYKCKDSYWLSRYYGRGIRVCDEWRKFSVFEKWALSHGWRRGLELDRIDNDGNYEPSNCRFVTRKENMRNTSRNKFVEYKGKRMTLIEAVERSGTSVPYANVNTRLRKGWDIERALSTPVNRRSV